MRYLNTKNRKLICTCLVAGFMGQIYVNPFSTDFRFSLSVVAFSLFVHWYHELSIIPTAIITGIFIFFLRVLIDTLFTEAPIITSIEIYLPVVIYYISFGILLKFFNYRGYIKEVFITFFLLSFADSLSNIVEIFIRNEVVDLIGVSMIFFVGMIRGLLTIMIREGTAYYERLLRNEEHEKRYKQLMLLTSNLKTEVFFLKKSMGDMEKTMEKSYQLYMNLRKGTYTESKNLSFQALSIANDVHEIKKDYLRISRGLEKILPNMESDKGMYIKDLFSLIKDSCEKNTLSLDKQVTIEFNYNNNIFVKQSYELISILNNLIINGIEAIDSCGYIKVEARIIGETIELLIEDDGEGILLNHTEVIFEPGYTTKFNSKTGKMNSGIGLTHVSYLVKDTLKGNIKVKSTKDVGTVFNISIPMKNL